MSNESYPLETISLNNLPKNSPLLYLNYGGIITMISDIVKDIRYRKRRQRLKLLNRRLKKGNMLAIYKENIRRCKIIKKL